MKLKQKAEWSLTLIDSVRLKYSLISKEKVAWSLKQRDSAKLEGRVKR